MKQRIGNRYEFDRQTDIIGRGGMGTVFVGIDTTTGQQVAIKQLKPDIIQDNPDFVERFNREAEALRRLNHPNIVAVLNTIADDDAHYLIMEYVSGGSLWEEMQNIKPMPIARVLQIALDLSDALTRAHRQKIIHRDLKPANVLIAHDGTPRLTDFGVAQIQDKTRVTRTGAVVGTLNYLSPEALNGDPIDERTDIWAFGVMLYEMLAGRSPFPEENTTALITAILTKPTADLTELRPDVSPMLARLVGQMLIKDREKRIDSIRKVGSELEDILRQSDSDANITTDFKREMMAQVEGRFDTPTPSSSPTPSMNVKPGTSRHGVTIVTSDTGEEYVIMPKRFANRLPLIMGVLLVLAFVIGIFIMTRPRFNGNETNITIVRPPNGDGLLATLLPNQQALMDITAQATIEEGEYPVAILPGSDPNTENTALQRRIQEVLRGIFETDIAFSNIRIVAETPQNILIGGDQPPLLGEIISQVGNDTRAVIIVRPEQREDGLYVILQMGDLSRFPFNNFERSVIERLVNVEILVNRPEDIAPYVAGAISILHSADGDMFEFMRTMTIISQLPPITGEVLSAGISASVYGYFANFVNDSSAALEAINSALSRDGGNALLFMYRSLVYLRQFSFENASSDIISAQRIGPENWTLPLYAIGTFAREQEQLGVLDAITTIRPEDWFVYYMTADYLYSLNDIDGARTALDMGLANNPQMNVVHLLSFIIAMREGRLRDAGVLLEELVRLFPDPNFSYRVLTATYGENFAVSILLYSSLANLIIGQFNNVVTDTDTLLSFIDNPESFIQNGSQLPTTTARNAADIESRLSQMADLGQMPYFYAGDLFMMRGIAFCSLGQLDKALESYSIGLGIDPNNHMLHLLRAEMYFIAGDVDKTQADIDEALGLSDEMDMFIQLATDADGDGEGLGCTNFFDVFIQIGRGE